MDGLPYPDQDAVPFTPITAEFYNETIANIEALAAGTGQNDGSISPDKMASPIIVDIVDDSAAGNIAQNTSIKSLLVPAGTWHIGYKWPVIVTANPSHNSRATLRLTTDVSQNTNPNTTDQMQQNHGSGGAVNVFVYSYRGDDIVALATPTTFHVSADSISASAASMCSDANVGYIRAVKLSSATS